MVFPVVMYECHSWTRKKAEHQRIESDAGKDWRQEERGWQRMRCRMASLNQWTWVWADSGRWWRTGKPSMLQSIGWKRVRHDLVTEQQQKYCYSGYSVVNLCTTLRAFGYKFLEMKMLCQKLTRFLHLSSSGIRIYIFFSCNIFVNFSYQGYPGLIK